MARPPGSSGRQDSRRPAPARLPGRCGTRPPPLTSGPSASAGRRGCGGSTPDWVDIEGPRGTRRPAPARWHGRRGTRPPPPTSGPSASAGRRGCRGCTPALRGRRRRWGSRRPPSAGSPGPRRSSASASEGRPIRIRKKPKLLRDCARLSRSLVTAGYASANRCWIASAARYSASASDSLPLSSRMLPDLSWLIAS